MMTTPVKNIIVVACGLKRMLAGPSQEWRINDIKNFDLNGYWIKPWLVFQEPYLLQP